VGEPEDVVGKRHNDGIASSVWCVDAHRCNDLIRLKAGLAVGHILLRRIDTIYQVKVPSRVSVNEALSESNGLGRSLLV